MHKVIASLHTLIAYGALLVYMPSAISAEFNHIQTEKSSLGFIYQQMGVPMEGSFKKFAAQLSFDPARLSTAKAVLDLDISSIDTGSEEGNDEVVSKSWFNAKVYPRAKFESTSFKALGGNKYEVSGKMHIKGRTQAVTAPFTLNQQGSSAVVDGSFVIKRADFAIGEGAWSDFGTVANEIQIKFHFLANAGR